MADDDPNFYRSSWGGVRLWIRSITSDHSRTKVVKDLSRGDHPVIQDRGLRGGRRTSCELLFDDDLRGESENGLKRLQRFIELVDTGKDYLFTHPVYGSYLAGIDHFVHTVDDTGTISASCDFVSAADIPAIVVSGFGGAALAGESTLIAAADDLRAQLDDLGIASTLPEDAKAAGSSWLDDASNARAVLVDVATFTDRAAQEADDLETQADLELWPLFKSYVLLSDAIAVAGAAATGDQSDVFSMLIAQPMSLNAILIGIYGADQVDRYRQTAIDMNDIETPGRIPSGTELKLVQPQTRARSA